MFRNAIQLVVVISVCLLCKGERDVFCKERHMPPVGEFGFPPLDEEIECLHSYYWDIRLLKKQSIELRFEGVNLRDSMILIQSKKVARETYKDVRRIEGEMEYCDVTVASPNKFVRIMMNGTDGSFQANYGVMFCPKPSPALTDGLCTNLGYRKYSVCHFQCREPLFYPSNPNRKVVRARCKGDQNWSTNLDTVCVSLQQLEQECFQNINMTCTYNIQQLRLYFNPRQLRLPEYDQYLDVVQHAPEIDEEFYEEAYIEYPPEEEGLSLAQLNRQRQLQICYNACIRHEPTELDEITDFVTSSCYEFEDKGYHKPCCICRYIMSICDSSEFL